MAAPNIINISTLTGKLDVVNLSTTSNTGIITNSSTSGSVYRVNLVRATNINGSNPSDITLSIVDSSASTVGYLAYTIAVPQDTTLTIIGKEDAVYLEEGDYIAAQSSLANYISVVACYEVIS